MNRRNDPRRHPAWSCRRNLADPAARNLVPTQMRERIDMHQQQRRSLAAVAQHDLGPAGLDPRMGEIRQ